MNVLPNSFNGPVVIDFCQFHELIQLSIAYSSFTSITQLSLSNLNKLTSLTIGENSFNQTTSVTISQNSLNSEQFHSFNFSSFTNLQHVTIQSNSLQFINTISFNGLHHLQSIIIQPYSLNYVNNFILSNPAIIQWNQIIHTIPTLLRCHPFITNLTIPKDSCNEANYTSLDLSHLSLLKELKIGNNSFTHIHNLTLQG